MDTISLGRISSGLLLLKWQAKKSKHLKRGITCLSGSLSGQLKERGEFDLFKRLEGKVQVRENASSRSFRASVTVESAFILPICIFLVLWIIQLGIMLYDTYTMSVTVLDWVDSRAAAGEADWQSGIQEALERRMIYPKPVRIISEGNGRALVEMDYFPFCKICIEVKMPKAHKERLYHFLNGRQLLERIPLLQSLSDQYFDMLRKLKRE